MTSPRGGTIIGLLVALSFVVMLLVERRLPGKALPKVRFWATKGLLFFLLSAAANRALSGIIAALLGTWSLLHLAWLGVVPGAVIASLAADLMSYGLHRTMHRVPFIWRWAHQMHHSAERMDVAGMAYTHPLETLFTIIAAVLAGALLGLTHEAAALAGLVCFAASIVQHMNIATPRWLGYFVSRPEAHGLHHARGIHAYNYAVFSIWDIAFGTFRNPPRGEFPLAYGFWDGASAKLGAMLLGRDVSETTALPIDGRDVPASGTPRSVEAA